MKRQLLYAAVFLFCMSFFSSAIQSNSVDVTGSCCKKLMIPKSKLPKEEKVLPVEFDLLPFHLLLSI
jgi:hypothetical protein